MKILANDFFLVEVFEIQEIYFQHYFFNVNISLQHFSIS